MDTPFTLPSHRIRPTVYVSEVSAATLPEEILSHILVQAPDTQVMYALNDVDGDRIALVSSRELAFSLAHENDLWPVSVH